MSSLEHGNTVKSSPFRRAQDPSTPKEEDISNLAVSDRRWIGSDHEENLANNICKPTSPRSPHICQCLGGPRPLGLQNMSNAARYDVFQVGSAFKSMHPEPERPLQLLGLLSKLFAC